MIYVASPYNSKDKEVMQSRMEVVYKVIAEYARRGEHAFSPLLMHAVVKRYDDLPTDFHYWQEFCLDFLQHAMFMVVVMQEGWDTSPGVQAEIDFCEQKKIPIVYYTI